MNFKFNGERETFYIQINVSKARPVCERFFKTEQRDVGKKKEESLLQKSDTYKGV